MNSLTECPELDVAILAARVDPCEHVRRRLEAIRYTCIDAQELVRTCLRENVLPLVYSTLLAVGTPVDAGLMGQIENVARRQATRWQVRRSALISALNEIRTLLQEEEIPFLFLRGLSFAERYYPDPSSRLCTDIDLLVPPQFSKQAEARLSAEGWHRVESTRISLARADLMGQVELASDHRGIRLDLNWRLTANASTGNVCPDMNAVWQRAASLNGCEKTLSPEDELVDLVRHVVHGHDCERSMLRTCVDAACFLRNVDAEVDLQAVARRAREVGCFRALCFFVEFYEHVYSVGCSCNTPLRAVLPSDGLCPPPREAQRFVRRVIVPFMLPLPPGAQGHAAFSPLAATARFWSVDGAWRMCCLLKLLVWPPSSALILLTRDDCGESSNYLSKRLAHGRLLRRIGLGILRGVLNWCAGRVESCFLRTHSAGREAWGPISLP